MAKTPAASADSAPLPQAKYWAFLSYSHADSMWAQWLHQAIETYRVPHHLVGRVTLDGPTPRQLFPVFRDREELPSAPELSAKVEEALRLTRYLIVICSPRAAASDWVDAEVRTFKSLRSENAARVLCLIVDGEPHASHSELECFPPGVRYQVDAARQLTDRRAEPLAGDARPGRDGRDGGLLKLLAGMLSVGFDELKQRERLRRRRRAMRRVAAAIAGVITGVLGYVAMADVGLSIPGGEAVRTGLDRRAMSMFRSVRGTSEIQTAAVEARRVLRTRLQTLRGADAWIPRTFRTPDATNEREVWSHSQTLAAVFSDPDATNDQLIPFVASLRIPFSGDTVLRAGLVLYGWPSHPESPDLTSALPALWTASALAVALRKPDLLGAVDRSQMIANLILTQKVLETYRPITAGGGWAMFPLQNHPDAADAYSTALALTALLESRKALLPWNGDAESRDVLLKGAADWLVDHFDARADPPGWRISTYDSNDGLTLQIYGTLLRAEEEAGVVIPDAILKAIPEHLIGCVERTLDFPVQTGVFGSRPFKNHKGVMASGVEGVGFFWYPWAIEASARWLARTEREVRPAEEVYRIRRVLSHLVVDLGPSTVERYVSGVTAMASELLYSLSTFPPAS